MKEKKKWTEGSSFWGVLWFAVLVLIDQLTKILSQVFLKERISFLGDWLALELVYNPGIAYGIGSDAKPIVKIIVIALTCAIMLAIAVAYFFVDKKRKLIRTAFVFIVAGGIGNLIDRVYYKVWNITADMQNVGVRDMVDLHKFGFAVCNFADFFITAGAVMLVLALLFFDKDAIFPVGKYKKMQREKEGDVK